MRRVVGLTSGELAQASCVAAEVVKDIEAGRTTPSRADLERIARALGGDLSSLFEGWV